MIVHDSWLSNGSARSTIIDYHRLVYTKTVDRSVPSKRIISVPKEKILSQKSAPDLLIRTLY